MSRTISPAALGASALALGFVAFAAGFAVSSAFPSAPRSAEPIVNASAWDETAPALPANYSSPANAQPRCSPWQISDQAMEEVLDEMLRRGWRAPTQGAAVALLDSEQASGVAAIDPNAQMIPRGGWRASATEEDLEKLPPGDTPIEQPKPAEPQPADAPKDERPPV